MPQEHGSPAADSVHFSRARYAVFAILIWLRWPYLRPRNNPATPGLNFGPQRSEVTTMKTVFSLIDAGFVATIAFGVFAATSDIATFSFMGL